MIIPILLYCLLAITLSYLVVQAIRCGVYNKKAVIRLHQYDPKIANLSYGNITYVDKGDGPVILSVHGIFGGFDQAFDICSDLASDYRIIAPSRFGYLGSDVLNDGTPKDQAKAFIELLDSLGIEKVFVLGTSAGGSVAIRFALDYPERTSGLILYSSAMPLNSKPKKLANYAGPPKILCNNYSMFLISPLFEPIMGMKSSTIKTMMPINKRKQGVHIDSSITNLDMSKNFDDYEIENIKCPTLIFHAKDDKLANYEDAKNVINRFPNVNFCSFEDGGHLIEGHNREIENIIKDFTKENK